MISFIKNNATMLFKEHYVIQNIASHKLRYLSTYAFLWACSLLLAIWFESTPIGAVVSYDVTKGFAAVVLAISSTTISISIPSCMNTIFSAYDKYNSTMIKQMLLQRFPLTMITIVSGTSMIICIAICSGVLGDYIPIPSSEILSVNTFWGILCFAYLFIALDKMSHFVSQAPFAVLDKLKLDVYKDTNLETQEDYDDFRQYLATMNDIAATTAQNSTGQDKVISKCLDAFREIHRRYAVRARVSSDPDSKRRMTNACRAVQNEMVRVYREAAGSKNVHSTASILQSYCDMVVDAVEMSMDNNYIDEMMMKFQKFQSYALASDIDEIEEQATGRWFFILGTKLSQKGLLAVQSSSDFHASMVRTLSATLRKATISNNEDLIVNFMQIASNADFEINPETIGLRFLTLLDRAIFIYINWLIATLPENCQICAEYLHTYSSTSSTTFRSVLCDSKERMDAIMAYGSVMNSFTNVSGDGTTAIKSSDKTALLMGMPTDMNISLSLSYLIMLVSSGMKLCDIEGTSQLGHIIAKSARKIASSSTSDSCISQRIAVANACIGTDVIAMSSAKS